MRLSLTVFAFVCFVFGAARGLAGVGDPQLRTDHPWYPGELACSTFDRLAATQAALYEHVTGIKPETDQDRALAAWLWRNTHYYHGEQGVEDLWGAGFGRGPDPATREYWTGLFAHGFGLCGTTHSQWTAEMQHLFGHNRARCVGVTGHNSFEVFLTGGSYGGFMTLWIVGHTNRFKAAVAQRSVTNWVSMWGSSDFNWIFQFWAKSGSPQESMDKLWNMSPVKYLGDAKTPTLIIHNEHDHRCPIEQGEQAFVALKRAGVETELQDGEQSGVTPDGLVWTARIERYHPPGADDGALRTTAYWVTIVVRWNAGPTRRTRSLQLKTLKLAAGA